MAYKLLAGKGDLVLVEHDDGNVYRYNLGRPDKIVYYKLADHPGARAGRDGWVYFDRDFGTVQQMHTWWTYDRTIPIGHVG